MKEGVNKILLVGELCDNPEIKQKITTANLKNVVTYINEKTKEKRERKLTIKLVFFDKTAEIANKYLKKGRRIYVDGSLILNSWEFDGRKYEKFEVAVSEFQFMDKKGE